MSPRFPGTPRGLAIAGVFVSCLLRPASGRAEDVPGAAEFRVNTVTEGIQQSASVGMTPGGDFVIAWQSEISGSGDDIRARRFGARGVALGDEFPVNVAIRGNQDAPSLAMDAQGAFVVVWQSLVTSHYVIRARRFDALGVPRGQEFEIDTRPREGHNAPAVAMSPDGRFVVAWESGIQGSFEIRARVFDSQGKAQGGELAVNAVTANSQRSPAVAIDAHGNFVVVWRSNVEGSFEIRARRFSAAGLTESGELVVNEQLLGDQLAPSVAMDAHGNFVVAWESLLGGKLAIGARRFSARGAALGGELSVPASTAGDRFAPAVAMDEAGDYVIAWHSRVGAGTEIRGRAFAANGSALGPELAVNTVAKGTRKSAAVALDAAGDFVVAWHSDTGGTWDVMARTGRVQLGSARPTGRAAAIGAASSVTSLSSSR